MSSARSTAAARADVTIADGEREVARLLAADTTEELVQVLEAGDFPFTVREGPIGPVNGKSPASSPPTRPKNWFRYWTTRSSVRGSHLPGSFRELPSHDTGWRRNRGAVQRAAVAGPPAHRAGPSTYRGSPSPLAGVDD